MRERQALSLEDAVWRLTGHPQRAFRIAERGIEQVRIEVHSAGMNFRDVIYFECKRKGNLQACLDDNFTIGSGRRIDFVFGQDGNGCRARVRRQHTISFSSADAAAKAATGGDSSLNYSDHRAIRAEIYY